MPASTFDRPAEYGPRRPGRRAFLKDGALLLAGSALLSGEDLLAAPFGSEKPQVRLGLVTDLHYADKDRKGNRCYRETVTKLAEARKRFVEAKPDILVEAGDLIDAADALDIEKEYLKRAVEQFSAIPGEHHYVVGNHCVKNLTKPDFLQIVGQERSYYSFDAKGYHFVILDACFRGDGTPYGGVAFKWPDANIPPAELEWLRDDLHKTPNKAIVFVHQCLDVGWPFGVSNGPEVRKVLEASGKVLAVIQGHLHQGNYQEIGNLHYCTLAGMVEGSGPENNAYAVMDILPGDAIRIAGFRRQKNFGW